GAEAERALVLEAAELALAHHLADLVGRGPQDLGGLVQRVILSHVVVPPRDREPGTASVGHEVREKREDRSRDAPPAISMIDCNLPRLECKCLCDPSGQADLPGQAGYAGGASYSMSSATMRPAPMARFRAA